MKKKVDKKREKTNGEETHKKCLSFLVNNKMQTKPPKPRHLTDITMEKF